MSDAPQDVPPGWYPDPTNGGRNRYWDGSQWTSTFAPGSPGAVPTSPATGTRPSGPGTTPPGGVPDRAGSLRRYAALAGAGLVGLVLGIVLGSGNNSDSPSAASVTEPIPTASVTMTVTQGPTPTITVTASPSTSDALASTSAPAAQPAKVKVPDGVGMNYQAAQDLWRSVGLVVLPATDATGAHRLPIIDSNWVVVAQDLKAGSAVEVGTGITATVKKYTDN